MENSWWLKDCNNSAHIVKMCLLGIRHFNAETKINHFR